MWRKREEKRPMKEIKQKKGRKEKTEGCKYGRETKRNKVRGKRTKVKERTNKKKRRR